MRKRNAYNVARHHERKFQRIQDVAACRAERCQMQTAWRNSHEPVVVQDESPAGNVQAAELPDAIHDANIWERKVVEYRLLRFKLARLTRLADTQRSRKLEREFRKLLKLLPPALPGTKAPAIQVKPIVPKPEAMPYAAALGTELVTLLETVPESSRLDVAAECICVKALRPDASAVAVLNRARSIVRMTRKGRFDGESSYAVEKRSGRDAYYAAERGAIAQWEASVVRSADVSESRVDALTAALDPVILSGLRQGLTRGEIADLLGVHQGTVTRRIDKALLAMQ